MGARLIGGPDLRARLTSLEGVAPEFASDWANATVTKIRDTKPASKEAASDIFTTKVTAVRAAVYGAFWWVFVDRGTKAHDIAGSGGKNPPNLLRFNAGGGTIFAPRVHHPRTRRVPFITRAAQESLAGSHFADTVVKLWNRRRIGGHSAFLP